MARFNHWGLTTTSSATTSGPFSVQTNAPGTIGDRIYNPGDTIRIAFLGQDYTFRGYEQGRGHLVFQQGSQGQYAILFNGNSGVGNGGGYTASGTIITNEPVQVAPPVVFADYGLAAADRGTAMGQEFKEFQVGFNSDRTGPYTVGTNTLRIPGNRVYQQGDRVTVTWSDGSRQVNVDVTFAGYEGDTSFPIFHYDEFRFSGSSVFRDGAFLGTTGVTPNTSYTPDPVVTNMPFVVGDTHFASANHRIEFNGIRYDGVAFEPGDIVELRTRNSDGDLVHTVRAAFVGRDRDSGNLVFDPPTNPPSGFPGGRQIIAAVNKQATYEVPEEDIVAEAWPRDALFSNYGFRQGNDLANVDFDLQGTGFISGLDVRTGVYTFGNILEIWPQGGAHGGEAVQVTFVGYVSNPGGADYPIFEAANFRGGANAQFIGTNEAGSGTYAAPSTIVTDMPLGLGEVAFNGVATREVNPDTGVPSSDYRFSSQSQPIKIPVRIYQVGDMISLTNPGEFNRDVEFVGYEEGTFYPVFRERADFGGLVFVTDHILTDVAGNSGDRLGREPTLVTDTPYTPCFAPGTLIATPDGERAVETLKPGDRVLTADGGTVSVRFVGFQKVPTLFGPRELTHPVRIRAGALGRNAPHTDLVVTRDHGMIVDGVICNAGALINGTSIVEVPTRELARVATYYHVETEGHVPLLANGAAAESFIDEVDRAAFANHGEFIAMYGSRAPAMTEMNLPRAMSMRQVPRRIWTRLDERAAILLAPPAAPSGVRRLWQELRDRVLSAGYRLVRGLVRGLNVA